MATTFNDNGGNTPNGSHLNFTYTFPVIKNEDVKVALNGITQASTKYTVNSGVNPTRIEFNNTSIDSTLQESTGAPKTGVVVRVYRDTGLEDPADKRVTFQAGSAIRAQDLNNMYDHLIYSTQEEQNQPGLITDADIIPTAGVQVSKLKDGVPRQLIQTNQAGTDVEWTDNILIPGTLEVTGATTLKNPTTCEHNFNLTADNRTFTIENSLGTDKFTVASSTGNTTIAGTLSVTGDFDCAAGSIDRTEIALDAIDSTRIADDSINSEHLVDGSIDTAHIANSQVTTAKLADDAVTNAKVADNAIDSVQLVDNAVIAAKIKNGEVTTTKLADDAVTNAKVAADAIDSVQLIDNAVIAAKIKNGEVTTSKIADNAITGDKFANNSITSAKFADNAVTTAKIAADAVTGAKIADDQINSEHYVDGSIDTAHIADSQITTAKIADDAITQAKIADDAIGADQLASNSVVSASIVDGTIVTADIADNAITNAKMADDSVGAAELIDASVGTAALASNAVTTAIIAAGSITSDKLNAATVVTASEQAAATLNDTSFLTSSAADARFWRQTSAESILDGATWTSNDNFVASTAAIDDRIIDLVDDVGGFVPIASETVFPNANPDVNNGAGTLVSVKSIGSTRTPSSGTVTIANGNVANNATITITGCGSTTLTAGFGVIVETTSTLHTYAFHRLVPKATEVTTVAGNITNINAVADNETNINTVAGNNSNITTVAGVSSNVTTVAGSISNVNSVASNIGTVNDFAARYRTGSTNPTSSLDTGDLFFNTTANELKVFNGSAWQGGVTATGNFAVVTGNTFTGNNIYNDTISAKFGTDSDLIIVHSGSDATIDNNTGDLTISTTGSGDDVFIDSADDISLRVAGTEDGIKIIGDGAVELFHNNVKKIETTSAGATVTGTLTADLADNSIDSEHYVDGSIDAEHLSSNSVTTAKINADAVTGAKIADDSIDSEHYVDGSIDNAHLADDAVGVAELSATGTASSSTFLRGDNSWATVTSVGGATGVDFNDSVKARFGTGNDLEIFFDGTNGIIQNHVDGNIEIRANDNFNLKVNASGGGAEDAIIATKNGSIELYFDHSKKFETTSSGATVTGTLIAGNIDSTGSITVDDSEKFVAGTGSDLQIYHNATDSIIDNSTGNLKIIAPNDVTAIQVFNDGTVNIGSDTDNIKLRFGIGSDLQIYHDGSNSFIDETGTGNLLIRAADEVQIKDSDSSEAMGIFKKNGAVELYYDNSLKAQTTSTGFIAYGNLHMNGDNRTIKLGGGDDLQIYHDGTDSIISHQGGSGGDLIIQTTSSDDDVFIKCNDDFIVNVQGGAENAIIARNSGAVELYHDASKKLETKSYGVFIDGHIQMDDSDTIKLGNGNDLQIYHDGSNSYIKHITASSDVYFQATRDIYLQPKAAENGIAIKADGAVSLYYDNSEKIRTTSTGFKTLGNAQFDDDRKVEFGDGQDLQIYHDASDSWIKNGTGTLTIQSPNINIKTDSGNENSIVCVKDAEVKLYYNNSWQAQTTNYGFEINGDLRPATNNARDLGSSSYRWNNLYVNDMHFSNNPDNPNSVDGTWGDWTLQEGENDIFMLNNRSGKKYKMALQEVS